MKKYFFINMILLSLSFAWGSEHIALSPEESEEYLKTLQQNVQEVKTIACTFKQEKHLDVFDDVLRLKGWAYIQKKPQSIRWEYTSPIKKVVLMKNDEMTVYKWKGDEKIQILNPNEKYIKLAYEYILSFFEGDFSNSKKDFDLSIRRDLYNKHLLVFTSSGTLKKYIHSIQILVSENNKSIEKVLIFESEENYTTINFTKMLNNVELQKNVFDDVKINMFEDGYVESKK